MLNTFFLLEEILLFLGFLTTKIIFSTLIEQGYYFELIYRKKSFKGVGMPWPKKFFFEFIVGLDRVAQDKLFGVGMTLLRPRVCPLETV